MPRGDGTGPEGKGPFTGQRGGNPPPRSGQQNKPKRRGPRRLGPLGPLGRGR